MLFLLSLTAFALPPTGTPARLEAGVGKVERMVVSPDGRYVAGRSRGQLDMWVLDIEDWTVDAVYLCDDVTGVAWRPVSDDEQELWVSCGDGTLRAKSMQSDVLSDILDADENPVELVLSDTLSGVWYYGRETDEGLLYAMTVDTDPASLHVIDPATWAIDSAVLAGYPLLLSWSNLVEGTVVGNTLFVAHEDDFVSRVTLGVSAPFVGSSLFGPFFDVRDVAPSPNGGFYAVDADSRLAEYSPVSDIFTILRTGLNEPNAVVASLDERDEWLMLTGLDITIWEMSSGFLSDKKPYLSIPGADNKVQDAVVSDGYVFGGGEGGYIHVTTARPWVYPNSVALDVTEGSDGDPVNVSFVTDEAGTWAVTRGGDRTGTGTVLATGDVSGADETITTNFTIDRTWDEGSNNIYIVHTNNAGLTGHATATLSVDNPPNPPVLSDINLGSDDEALWLEFAGIPDADLDYYDVYVSTTSFQPSDWDTAGPEFNGATELEAPIRVTAEGGASVSVRIAPLNNDTVYYIAVRATDLGGLEGPMSNVVSGQPKANFTAADLAGEEGGSPPLFGGCNTATGGAVGWLAIAAAAVGLRRRSGAMLGAILALGLFAGEAEANDRNRDQTPQKANVEIRYGTVNFMERANGRDNVIDLVYKDNPHNILQVEVGPQFGKMFELDVGFGFFQELAFKIDETGAQSNGRTMLTWFPMALDATARLHIIDEQLIVPFFRYGMDYVLYTELSDNGMGGKDRVRGVKMGNHMAGGINFLLDALSPNRASLLEAQTGINDSYLTIEFRTQNVDHRSSPFERGNKYGLDFSATMVTLGIKMDY